MKWVHPFLLSLAPSCRVHALKGAVMKVCPSWHHRVQQPLPAMWQPWISMHALDLFLASVCANTKTVVSRVRSRSTWRGPCVGIKARKLGLHYTSWNSIVTCWKTGQLSTGVFLRWRSTGNWMEGWGLWNPTPKSRYINCVRPRRRDKSPSLHSLGCSQSPLGPPTSSPRRLDQTAEPSGRSVLEGGLMMPPCLGKEQSSNIPHLFLLPLRLSPPLPSPQIISGC